eukprot:745658-Hanusia_phi.AAC.1
MKSRGRVSLVRYAGWLTERLGPDPGDRAHDHPAARAHSHRREARQAATPGRDDAGDSDGGDALDLHCIRFDSGLPLPRTRSWH